MDKTIGPSYGSNTLKEQARFPSKINTRARAEEYLAAALFYATLAPPELSFTVGTFVIHVYRILLFLSIPFIARGYLSGRVRPGHIDLLVIFSGIWMFIATTVNHDIDRALETGLISSFDLVLSYLLGRVCICSTKDLILYLKRISPGIFIAGSLILIESIYGGFIFRPVIASITGNPGNFLVNAGSFRQGLFRGTGFYSHGIIGAIQLSSFVPLYLLARRIGWRKSLAIIGSFFSIFAWSSASLLALVLGIVMTGYELIKRRVASLSWPLAVTVLTIAAIVIQFASKGGLVSIIFRYLTFDPATGYFRSLIWRFGSADVLRHPLFGIGFNEYQRPSWMITASVDAHWLLIALQFGLPAALSLLIASVSAAVSVGRVASRRELSPETRSLLVAVSISLSISIIAVFSVAIWGHIYSWFMFTVGTAASLGSLRRSIRPFGLRAGHEHSPSAQAPIARGQLTQPSSAGTKMST